MHDAIEPADFDIVESDYDLSPHVRDYQGNATTEVLNGWKHFDRILITLATGLGKTVIFCEVSRILAQDPDARILIIAHTEELVTQSIQKLQTFAGIQAALEKANSYASAKDQVVCASIQTIQGDKRLAGFGPDHFTHIIIDEAHRSLAKSYTKVVEYFENAKLLGVTATPDRGDQKSLGRLYEQCVFEFSLLQGVNEGWLVRPWVKTVPLKIDLSDIKVRGGDYDAGEVGHRIDPFVDDLAEQIENHYEGRKTMIFVPTVETASLMSEALNKRAISADWVAGDKKRCPDRTERIERFRRNQSRVVVNAMLLCLDMETEILTDKGFVKHDQMTTDHKVANWNFDGSVFFKEPIEIVKRPIYPEEYFVHIDSRTINMRVTNTHRMIVNCGFGNRGWKKKPASDLRPGDIMPTNGIAEPFNIVSEQAKNCGNPKRRISANAYNLRKNGTCKTFDESIHEATKRISERNKLRYKNPDELSYDECRLIGFWIADGSKAKLQSGGVEYTFCQSIIYPHIIEWFDKLLKRLELDFKRHPRVWCRNPHIRWSLSRGTGFGPQKRKGIYALEPYLEKHGSNLFWGLDKPQFDALIEGYWMGDGYHGSAENGIPDSLAFNETSSDLINLFSSIGSVRGWRCSSYPRPQKNPKHRDQTHLRMRRNKGSKATISSKTEIKNETGNTEMVWCVKTDSKNIITRRKGKVMVMGNTEGFDDHEVSCIVVLRPTKIRSLYVQAVGRGTRTIPGILDGLATAEQRCKAIADSAKPNLLILDFLWLTERLDLVRPANLVTGNVEVAERVSQRAEGDLIAATQEEEKDFLESLRNEAAKHARKKGRLFDPLAQATSFGIECAEKYQPQTQWEALPPTVEQVKFLAEQGVDTRKIPFRGLASKWIRTITERKSQGLCSLRQANFLRRIGYKDGDAAAALNATAKAAKAATVGFLKHKKRSR